MPSDWGLVVNFIADGVVFGKDVEIGVGNIVEKGAVIGDNVKIGNYCIIGSDVSVGSNTVVMNYVELRSGTKIGADCYIDSRVSTSGDCVIGNGVTLRYGVIIAKGCDIGDGCYLSPGVMTNNLDKDKVSIGGAKLGRGCFVGSKAVLHHGISLPDGCVVGAMSFVTKSHEIACTLVGVPARQKQA